MENEIEDFGRKSYAHCLLMGLDGVTYKAQIGDLSLKGALIKISDNVPTDGLHLGEMCGLVYSDNPKMPSTKHTGKIVKLDSFGSVGISFNHQEHQHQKHKYSPGKVIKVAVA